MNVLLVSECNKNALKETRRLLDQFAERRGDRTWQTAITQDGLDTLRRLLRKTARKNTAVACHWIRSRDHSELLWVVGDAGRFNTQGAVPTNTTVRDQLRRHDENDWHSLQDIRLLATFAALLHDLGKACRQFQSRLERRVRGLNHYRHEWISLRLFQAFVGDDRSDEAWLQRLSAADSAADSRWITNLQRDGLDDEADTDRPLAELPPLAQAIAWLVVTHHRLPVMPATDADGRRLRWGAKKPDFRVSQLDDLLRKIGPDWNESCELAERQVIETYWDFPQGLPVTTPLWRKRAAKIARRLLELIRRPDRSGWLDDPYVMHLARLSLMLADHHYSSLSGIHERERGEKGYPIYANTDRKTGELCQPLDEHLLGVEKHASIVAHALPGFERRLPRLVRHKGLRRRSRDERFRWQDRATDLAASVRLRATLQGAFLVNLASTGCGKTLANARIMNALADPQQGLRCAFALGLRTLTLQTGHQFRGLLNLSDDQLAIRVGGAPNRELFEHYEQEAEKTGSASMQALFPEDDDAGVLYEGDDTHPLLQRAMKDSEVRKLLSAPILVCTVDHLTPATESKRGGRQIAPMLRLMSGDLVLDELDDFDIDDMPALTRLVHWAGLLGGRVLLSSATLPPALVQGMFEAYRAGREIFQRNRGERPGEPVNICCGWFDEFDQQAQDCPDADGFARAHLQFASKRHERLTRTEVRRRVRLVELENAADDKPAIRDFFAGRVLREALALHAHHHATDPASGKRVSFGLVRMANIGPLFDVALALYARGAPERHRIHLCVYHSQFPLLLRSAIERRLDRALDRRDESTVFHLPDVRAPLDAHDEPDHLFVVLSSPVSEVGRDHDYDWAVVEPSSMRSLIQLAGRVRRHRPGACVTPNIAVFDTNLRHYEHPGEAAYCKPGFETSDGRFRLATHRLDELLTEDERSVIDARPRLLPRPREQWQPQRRLVDLEHARIHEQMLAARETPESLTEREVRMGKKPVEPRANAASILTQPLVHLTAVLPQQQPFRDDSEPKTELVIRPTEDEDGIEFWQVRDSCQLANLKPGESVYVPANERVTRIDDARVQGHGIAPWGASDYLVELERLATSRDLALDTCARRYGIVTLPRSERGWRFHPALGFSRKDEREVRHNSDT